MELIERRLIRGGSGDVRRRLNHAWSALCGQWEPVFVAARVQGNLLIHQPKVVYTARLLSTATKPALLFFPFSNMKVHHRVLTTLAHVTLIVVLSLESLGQSPMIIKLKVAY